MKKGRYRLLFRSKVRLLLILAGVSICCSCNRQIKDSWDQDESEVINPESAIPPALLKETSLDSFVAYPAKITYPDSSGKRPPIIYITTEQGTDYKLLLFL